MIAVFDGVVLLSALHACDDGLYFGLRVDAELARVGADGGDFDVERVDLLFHHVLEDLEHQVLGVF